MQRLMGVQMSGEVDRMKAMVEQCMSEYDLDGWKMPGFVNPADVSVVGKAR